MTGTAQPASIGIAFHSAELVSVAFVVAAEIAAAVPVAAVDHGATDPVIAGVVAGAAGSSLGCGGALYVLAGDFCH